ncbi:hypothetical protein L208DRAFT_1276516, partial [Tricholoma matsutake]
SSHNEPLGQMLLTNQWLDKLVAAQVNFASQKMLDGSLMTMNMPEPPPLNDEDNDMGDASGMTSLGDVKLAQYPAKGYSKTIKELADQLNQAKLAEYVHQFLYDQLHPDSELCGMDVPLDTCPKVHGSL